MSTAPERPPLPDHLSIDERSPHYSADVLAHAIGIRFNDKERHDVEEYCISEAGVKVPAGTGAPKQPAASANRRGPG